MIVLVTGGSGCGKSTWAEKLVDTLPRENRIYIATMQVYDEESVKRVARHRAQRADKGFATIECEKDLAAADVPAGSVVLLEDLVNLTANEMFDDEGNYSDPFERVISGVEALQKQCDTLIVVTNDVGTDCVTYDASTQAYIEVLGRINAELAVRADSVCELVCGIPLVLKGELPG